jgi:hypothetical protein
LVAVAVASTLLVHVVAPAGWKNSCENVFSGWPRWPIGNVAQVPALDCREVASGVGMVATVGVPAQAGAAENTPSPIEVNSAQYAAILACTRPGRGERRAVTSR